MSGTKLILSSINFWSTDVEDDCFCSAGELSEIPFADACNFVWDKASPRNKRVFKRDMRRSVGGQ